MESLLTLPRLARHLGVTATWLRAEADAGRLPCLKAGRRYLFDPQAVEAVLLQRASKRSAATTAPQAEGPEVARG